jgi:hypothetical protein
VIVPMNFMHLRQGVIHVALASICKRLEGQGRIEKREKGSISRPLQEASMEGRMSQAIVMRREALSPYP